ncbi:MAG: response regulator [Oculatellaceae cyanobacterium Prado106]|jgi:CheY-like chemotaxis protein|nr:response regulator [Oculatellaceae cyanobacterium Prado106]
MVALPAHLSRSRPCILIVDDNPDNTGFLQMFLESEGYVVTVAHSGQEALQQIQTTAPQLVLMDVMMPAMDGFAVVRKIRRDRHHRSTPVILLTAYDEPMAQGWKLGANDLLQKPVELNELISRIQTYLPL